MSEEQKKRSQARRIVSETRTWSSGAVRFSVIGIEGHPENNYIILERDLVGRQPSIGVQRFNLSLKDWNNLKRLIEVDLADKHCWAPKASGMTLIQAKDAEELSRLVEQQPELVEKILSLPNLRLLSTESFESLNRLAINVYRVQLKNVELVLETLSQASAQEFIQFASLLNHLKLGQVAALANLVRQKLEIVELFERLASSKNTREKEIHELIENNAWIADKSYEILSSDRPLAEFLKQNAGVDPELRKRPDLIAKRVPNQEHIVLIELKRPEVELRATHIGQVLHYKALINRFKPNTKRIDCYLFGYKKHPSFCIESKDVTIRTYAEIISTLRDEYQKYLAVLEESSGGEGEQFADFSDVQTDSSDIPF